MMAAGGTATYFRCWIVMNRHCPVCKCSRKVTKSTEIIDSAKYNDWTRNILTDCFTCTDCNAKFTNGDYRLVSAPEGKE